MLEHYTITNNDSEFIYEFYSVGDKGSIRKIVRFLKFRDSNYYHFGFADFKEDGNHDDKIVSNNGDAKLILATLAAIVEDFTNNVPDAWIYAKGSSKVKTRFYRIILSNNLALVEEKYNLWGMLKGVWKPFEPNKPYTEYLLKRK